MEGEEQEVQEAAEEVQEGGAARKRKWVGGGDGEDGKEEVLVLGEEEEDGEDVGLYEGIAEEAVAEVMRWLEAEIAPGDATAAAAPGFVTINGNEESCGPSFSAAASTVMASVDTRAGAPPPPPVPWPCPEPGPGPGPGPAQEKPQALLPAGVPPAPEVEKEEDAVGSGGDGEAGDEEWLARLLTCGALLEGGPVAGVDWLV